MTREPRTSGKIAAYDTVRVLVAALLWAAAIAKGYELATAPGNPGNPAPGTPGILSLGSASEGRFWLIALVGFEWVLGLLLFSGLFRRAVWGLTLGCFAVFSAVSLYQAAQGHTSCGCFGAVEVNPWITLTVDLALTAALVVFRPGRGRPQPTPMVRTRLALTALLALVVGVPGVWVMAAYRPGQLDPDGRIVGDLRHVVLEPDTWEGRPFPLVNYIDIGGQLASGKWTVLLYHHDCPNCQTTIKKLLGESTRQENDARLALVEVPPYSSEPIAPPGKGDRFAIGRLRDDRDWFVPTPVILRLDQGTVTSIYEGLPAGRTATSEQAKPTEQVAAGNPSAAPPSRQVHDFGYVEPGSTHKAEFLIENPLAVPLTIRKVQVECQCTEVDQAPEQIAPGESATVHVTFRAPDKRSTYSKRIMLHTTDPDRPVITLRVAARIGIPLRVEPDVLDFGTLVEGEVPERMVCVFNDGADPVRLLYSTSNTPGCIARVPRLTIEPGGSGQVPVVVSMEGKDPGTHDASISIHTTSKQQRVLQVHVRFQVVGKARPSADVL